MKDNKDLRHCSIIVSISVTAAFALIQGPKRKVGDDIERLNVNNGLVTSVDVIHELLSLIGRVFRRICRSRAEPGSENRLYSRVSIRNCFNFVIILANRNEGIEPIIERNFATSCNLIVIVIVFEHGGMQRLCRVPTHVSATT